MPVIEVEQQSTEWMQMRAGCCTASRLHDVIKKLKRNAASGKKGEPAATRGSYAIELACERLTGFTADHYVTPFMDYGTEWEPVARAAYEMATGNNAIDGGFALHPAINYFGASIDFRVGTVGGGEIKCFQAEKHYRIVTEGVIPDEVLPQMIGEMACYELAWVDFVSFHKDFGDQKLFIRRLHRDATSLDTIASVEAEVKDFLKEVRDMVDAFKTKQSAMIQL